MITPDQYLVFVDRALGGMVGIVEDLGDTAANLRPELPGANSPYAILHHCLGVIDYWAGYLVAGRPVDRDRDAEFKASGPTAELVARANAVRDQLARDVAGSRFDAELTDTPPESFQGPGFRLTQGAALIHVYEELAQHHGQMQLVRDLVSRP